jgi:hypothetical protein
MGLFDVFIKDVETKDNHKNQALKSHYYKNEYRECKEAVLNYVNTKKYKVKNINDNFGEILIETSRFSAIITIRGVSMLETAIDLKVTVYSLIGAFKPHKQVKAFYDVLDKNLRYLGTGLHS